MKKIFILGLVLLASTVSAQSFVITPMVGYSHNSFEDACFKDVTAGNMLLGIAAGVLNRYDFELGLELVNPVKYVFRDEASFEITYQNYMIGTYGKKYFRLNRLDSFLKIGGGYFLGRDGDMKRINENVMCMGGEFEFEESFGFTVGAGVMLNRDFFVELDYSRVTREVLLGSSCMIAGNKDMNTLNLVVGYQLSFGD